jgi:hypothetical protein
MNLDELSIRSPRMLQPDGASILPDNQRCQDTIGNKGAIMRAPRMSTACLLFATKTMQKRMRRQRESNRNPSRY